MMLFKKKTKQEPSFREVIDAVRWADDDLVLKAVQSGSPIAERARKHELTFEDKLLALTGVSRWVRAENEYGDYTEDVGEWTFASGDHPFTMGYREDAPASVIMEMLNDLRNSLGETRPPIV